LRKAALNLICGPCAFYDCSLQMPRTAGLKHLGKYFDNNNYEIAIIISAKIGLLFLHFLNPSRYLLENICKLTHVQSQGANLNKKYGLWKRYFSAENVHTCQGESPLFGPKNGLD
jgi:hypothetical protein